MALRVIAGSAGGRRLVAPKGGARPTTDRLKEALFASLGRRIDDAVVLDLYAGPGALGLEALSRGATRAVFVEHDADAVRAIEQNLDKLRLTGARVLRQDAPRSRSPKRPSMALDPPYDTASDDVAGVLKRLAARRARPTPRSCPNTKGGVLVDPPAAGLGTQRAHGDTLLVGAHLTG
jgi:16S rRNA (guanine966-N2)-methyltransferase